MRGLISFLTFVFSLNAFAGSATPPSNFAAGLMIGTITSINGKYWLSKRGALDFGIGFSGSPDTALYADYLYHIPNVFGAGSKFTRETAGYIGGGGGIAFWDDSYECGRFGCDRRTRRTSSGVFIRGLVGLEWYAAPTRFGVFGELGPTILFAPVSASGLDAEVGGRFYF